MPFQVRLGKAIRPLASSFAVITVAMKPVKMVSSASRRSPKNAERVLMVTCWQPFSARNARLTRTGFLYSRSQALMGERVSGPQASEMGTAEGQALLAVGFSIQLCENCLAS